MITFCSDIELQPIIKTVLKMRVDKTNPTGPFEMKITNAIQVREKKITKFLLKKIQFMRNKFYNFICDKIDAEQNI